MADKRGRGRGRGHGRDRTGRDDRPVRTRKADNVKSTYEHLPETNDPVEIRRQVEFYFSDSNLPTDRFLLKETGGSKNIPFPLAKLHSFKRMQRFQPFSAVRDAIKESKTLNLDENDGITRVLPLFSGFSTFDITRNKDMILEKTLARSVYVKLEGFGAEDDKTQTDAEEFFQPYQAVDVRLRRVANPMDRALGEWKGSVFVEFTDKPAQEAFLALDEKPLWKGRPIMRVMTKEDYLDMKELEERHNKERRKAHKDFLPSPDHYRPEKAYKHKRRDTSVESDDWKERRARDQKNDRKRAREDGDDKDDEPMAKKSKDDATRDQENGRKRAREDDDDNDDEPMAKKSKDNATNNDDGKKAQVGDGVTERESRADTEMKETTGSTVEHDVAMTETATDATENGKGTQKDNESSVVEPTASEQKKQDGADAA